MNFLISQMKLFETQTIDDFGKEFYITILKYRNWSLFRSCVQWMEYGRSFPYLKIVIGYFRLFEIEFQFLKFAITISIISKYW